MPDNFFNFEKAWVSKKLSEYHIYNSIIEEIHNTEIATITFLLPA
jgi:hypothetical protein